MINNNVGYGAVTVRLSYVLLMQQPVGDEYLNNVEERIVVKLLTNTRLLLPAINNISDDLWTIATSTWFGLGCYWHHLS